ncbi:MAG: flagellar hook-basal body complex protein FliE [Angelakisella sp.]|nr:flagellar hook-basal body complex protein FliE [Angelakisella sp.]
MFIVPLSQLPLIKAEENVDKFVGTEGVAPKVPFFDVLKQATQATQQAQEVANQDSYDLSMGNVDNLAAVMINSAKATTALEMTVQLTSRAVSSYKEIMQMQV